MRGETREDRLKLVWQRVLLPWLGSVVAHTAEKNLKVPHLMEALLPSLAELFTWWAILGIASLLALELMKGFASDVMQDTREHILPDIQATIRASIRDLARVLAQCISDKEFFPLEVFSRVPTQPPQPVLSATDPKLAEAKRLMEVGRTDEAANILSALAKKDVKYEQELLKVLVYSTKEEHWKAAASLLKKHGSLPDITLLSYKYWAAKNFANAIEYAADGLKVALEQDDAVQIARCRNNLAYYLADGEVVDRADEARQLAMDAVNAVKKLRKEKHARVDDANEARVVATLGYVKITFARDEEELQEGVKLCEEGHERGANLDLLLRHMERARARLVELRRTATNQ